MNEYQQATQTQSVIDTTCISIFHSSAFIHSRVYSIKYYTTLSRYHCVDILKSINLNLKLSTTNVLQPLLIFFYVYSMGISAID